MFSGQANPYDELVTKATDENLASEDWAINLEVCDKVTAEGNNGARNAVGALVKRLAHRNPNVQIYALELANTLAQNCGKPLHEELSSRTWTGAVERLIGDRATVKPVQTKALKYVKDWAQQFEGSGDPNLSLMGELYDKLKEKGMNFGDQEEAPGNQEDVRRRAEEEELARAIEISKEDRGRGWVPPQPHLNQGSSSQAGGSSQPPRQNSGPQYPQVAAAGYAQPQQQSYSQPQQQQQYAQQQQNNYGSPPGPEAPLDLNTATRVRALYTFESAEVGELNFERGDIIKVLDRNFKEWWRGASNGKIGIFPVTYVEALPEPSSREVQEEAQKEARVFASLGLVDQLLQTLKGIDTTRGERIEDRPEVEEMYQASVSLQTEINALIKKYSDQKAELEHMNNNFLRAMRQYEELRGGVPQPQQQYYPQQGGPPQADPYAQQQQQQPYQQQQPQHPQQGFPQPNQYVHGAPTESPGLVASIPGQNQQPAPGQVFYQQGQGVHGHSTTSLQSGAPAYPPASPPARQTTAPGQAGVGAGAPAGGSSDSGPNPQAQQDHAAAWDAYYRAGGQPPPGHAAHGAYPQQAAPHPGQQQQQQPGYAPPGPHQYATYQQQGVDGVAAGINRMSVQQ